MMKCYSILFLFLISFPGRTQSLKAIEQLEISYQNCLDSGSFIKNCSIKFYAQTDSLLKLVYNKLEIKLDSAGKSNLKREQIEWEKGRDIYFNDAYKETIAEFGNQENSQDFQMLITDKKSGYVMNRVKELLKRI